jgi:ketosteroid isomerase-like protein
MKTETKTAAATRRRVTRCAAVLAPLLVVSLSCSAGGDRESTGIDPAVIEQELIQADREFAEAVAETGLDGWVSYFTSDAARLELVADGPLARGTEAIRTLDARLFADPMIRLTWEPLTAGVFRGGDHGFTRGRFEVINSASPSSAGTVTSHGTYLTLWRREPQGWRVILDTGVVEEGVDP